MKHNFSNFQEWKTAALAAGLIIERQYHTHEGMHEDDMLEPSFCGKILPRTVEFPEEDVFQPYGIFSTDWDEDGKAGACSGFFFDTPEEWEKEVEEEMKNWEKDEALVKLPESPTPVLDHIVRLCVGPTEKNYFPFPRTQAESETLCKHCNQRYGAHCAEFDQCPVFDAESGLRKFGEFNQNQKFEPK